jgi:hypothetical protein
MGIVCVCETMVETGEIETWKRTEGDGRKPSSRHTCIWEERALFRSDAAALRCIRSIIIIIHILCVCVFLRDKTDNKIWRYVLSLDLFSPLAKAKKGGASGS